MPRVLPRRAVGQRPVLLPRSLREGAVGRCCCITTVVRESIVLTLWSTAVTLPSTKRCKVPVDGRAETITWAGLSLSLGRKTPTIQWPMIAHKNLTCIVFLNASAGRAPPQSHLPQGAGGEQLHRAGRSRGCGGHTAPLARGRISHPGGLSVIVPMHRFTRPNYD